MSDPRSEELWQQFLQSIYDDNYKPNEEEEEEEVNDPEYKISEDLLNLEDDWEFSDQRAFKVSDYELDLLLDEDENDVEVQTVQKAIDTTEGCREDNVFNAETMNLLVSQMSQHIQLLAQNYLLSRNTVGLQTVAENANSMLNKLNEMSKKNPIFGSIPIIPVMDLISCHPIDRCNETRRVATSWRTLPVTKENQKIFISNINIFIHPWLLPICSYYDQKEGNNKRKTVFTLSEDHLIALGLEQLMPMFSPRKCYRYLKQLLLPNKSVDQIRTHIKNIKRRSTANNPIKYYWKNKRAPDIHSTDHKLDLYRSSRIPPDWYKKAFKVKASKKEHHSTNSGLEVKRLKPIAPINEYKRIRPTNQQSPVKQTNSIVKKYKYLNRLNHIKQNLLRPSSLSPQKRKDNEIKSNDTFKTNDLLVEVLHIEGLVTKDGEKDIGDEGEIQLIKDVDNNDQTKELSASYDQHRENQIIDISINEDDIEYDDESDLVALMTASSTITIKNKSKSKNSSDPNNSALQLNQNRKEGRKSLAVKHRESTLQLLSSETNQNKINCEQREDILIQNFLEKVRNCLTHDNYVNFLTLLSNFHRNQTELSPNKAVIKEIYFQIEDFLKRSNVNKDIISELVLFLNAQQAEECGKMFEYLYWKRVFNFVNKIEKYSQIDSQCLSRFYRSLNQLKATNPEDLDDNKIRCAVNRSLNGHSYLMHHFSSLLLMEKPSKYLFDDKDFDEVVVDSSDDEDKTDSAERMCFENINIPENQEDLKYGTNECPCSGCHKEASQPINNHCTSCSIRFIGGRVYLTQNHKKLGLAEIRFSDISEDLCNDSKLSEQVEDMTIGNDKEADAGFHQLTDKVQDSRDSKGWTMNEDKMLLELCRFKVIEEKHNDLSEDIFEEVAIKLSKETNDVISRFNKLMDLFASEQDTHSTRVTSEANI